jgi:PKD repeat protein
MRKHLLSLFLFSISLFSFNNSYSQTWVEMMKDPDANFYETVNEFEDYWSTRTVEKGKGYKPFRRWQDLMAPRVFPKGDVKQANRAKDEFLAYKQLHPEAFESSGSRAANWTLLGPNGAPAGGGAGRINFVRIHPTNSNILYAGSPAGGLWITTNGGTSWSTNTDQLSVIGCTDIAIDPTNTQVMYLATGDGDAGDTYSIGVLKSTDGGGTWNTTGLTWTITQGRTISRLLVNPSNTQIVLAATSNGIYRSTDGGTSWTQEQTGNFKDMEFMPTAPATIYASGTTFWKSTDSGNTFAQITSGVPTGVSRIAIATTDANSAYVYLLAANNTDSGLTGVYRSTNSGTTFTTRATTPNLLGWNSNGGDAGGQGWYDLAIAASPTNADVVVVGGVNIWRSTNGGTNWTINGHWTGTGAPYVHADIHDLIFLPGNGTTYYSGNDGGVFRTTNSGTAWTDLSANMSIAQQYELGLSTSNATRLVTGHQDNGTNLMNGTTWTEIYGGDGMQCFIDRTNNNVIYASYVYGDFQRSTNGGANWTNIVTGLTGNAAWEAPIHQDPVVANTLYCGYQNMFKSTNQGTAWTQIGTLTGTGSLVEFDVAPSNTQIIYAIKSNAVFKTTNGGTNWTNVTGTLPIASAALTYVEISPTDPNKVWVTFSGYSTGNKVFMSTNGGTSWTNYSTGLPNIPVNCIVYQTGSTDGVYIGTDVGVYYRDNSFATWQPYLTGLPNVIVRDLEIYNATGKIRAATFGRGTWESDLYSPGTNAPIADFTASNRNVCPGSTVVFTDLSSYTPTSWSWTFGGGGTPNTSTAQNPSIVFNTPGVYTVTLIATNANGSDTETKTSYITVSSPIALPLVEGFQNATFAPTGWSIVDINANGTWARTTAAGGFGTSTACAWFDNYAIDEAGSRDRLETPKYDFSGYSSATMTFDVAYARYNATYSDSLAVLVSLDCGQTFTQVYLKGGTTLSTRADLTTAFTPTATEWRTESVNMTPYVGNPNVLVVFQNRGRYGNNIYLDNVNITGVSTPSLPVADFTGTPTTLCAGQTVTFNNISTGSPTSYAWTFTGGTPATSTATNPTVTYNTAGTYTVTLVATNGSGNDTETKTNYIIVNALPTATAGSNSPLCVGATLNLTTPTVAGATYSWTGPSAFTSTQQNPTRSGLTLAMAGTYTVTVTANGCTSTSSVNVVINASPTSTASSNSPVCTGNSLNLATPTVAGATYSWTGPNSFTSTSQNPTITGVTTAATGSYSVTVTAGGCSATSSTSVVINTTPTATAGSNSPLCAGQTLNLTTPTVAGATYAWSGPGGYTSTSQNPTRTNVTTVMAGSYTVTVTANGCTATSSVTVVIGNAPTASAGSNSPVCSGNTINLTTTTITGATYSWTGPNGFTSSLQNPTIASSTTVMSGSYSVTVTLGSCTATSSVNVTVNAAPTATAGSNSPICAGATLNLTTNTVTGATYAWTGPGGFTSSLQNPTRPSSTTAMSGSYSVTVTSNGCTATSSVNVTINNAPTASAGSNTPVCSGNTINLTTTTVAGATYSWTGPNGFTSSLQNPTIASSTTAMSGSYTVTVTNGCSANSSTTVTVNATPTANAGSNSPICSGATLNLTTTTVAGATYSWSGPGGYTSTAQNPTRPSATTAMSGTYTVTVTANGCTATSSVTATINTSPTANATSNTPVCSGNNINLSTNAVAGATYAWTGPAGFTSSAQSPSITNATTLMSGTYTVTVNNGCSVTSSTTVTVNASPAALAGSNSPLCSGSTLNLTTTTVAGATYAWTGPGGYTSTSQNPTRPSATTAMSGTYTVTVTAGGCSSTSSVSVTINATPTATASSNSPVCVGQTINLATPTVSGATYAWAGPSGYTSTAQNPTRPSATTTMGGSYTVTVTANGCTATSTTAVTVNTLPTATATSNSPICAGSTITLSTPTVGGATFAWTGPGGFTSAIRNPSITGATTAMSGNYVVTVTGSNGCTNTSTVTVTVNALPTATAGSNSPLCAGQTLNLSTPTVAGATYAWAGPGGYTSTAQNPNRTNVTTAMAGIYTVTVTANGCSSTSNVSVVINNVPTASAGSNSPVCSGNSINLTTTTVAGATYAWTGPGGFTSTLQNPSITGATTGMSGSYTVTVNNGCTATSSTTVTVNASPSATATSNSPICAGTTLTLTTPAVTGATYAWSGPGGYNAATRNANRPSATTAMSGAYTVTVTAGGCSTTSTVNVTINNAPVTTASSNTPICTGNTINLTTTTVSGATYSWSGPNGFTSNVQSPSITNATSVMAGTYTVTVNNGCTASTTTSVVINTTPTVIANASSPSVCAGNSLTLTGGGASTYTWNNSVINGASFIPTGTLTYTVTGTASNGCIDTDQISVTVNALPIVVANTTSSGVCPGNSVTLSGGGAVSYSWDNLVTNGLAFTPTATNTYTVIGTDGNNCQNTDQVTVTVHSLPVVTATASANPICQGDDVRLNGGGATSYTWDNSVVDNVSFFPGGTLTYTVTGTDGNSCQNTAQITVTVNPLPTVSYAQALATDTVCRFRTVPLTIGSPSGGTYTGAGVTGTNFNATTAGVGNHDIIYSFTDGNGCTNFDTSIINVEICKFDIDVVDVSVGISEEESAFALQIVPNPTTGEFTIILPENQNENIIVSIYNSLGQIIFTVEVADHTTTLPMSLSNYARGLYHVMIQAGEQRSIQKLIKN